MTSRKQLSLSAEPLTGPVDVLKDCQEEFPLPLKGGEGEGEGASRKAPLILSFPLMGKERNIDDVLSN